MGLREDLSLATLEGRLRLYKEPVTGLGDVELEEVTAPGTPLSNFLRLYAKDKSGTSALYYKNDAGTEIDLSGGLTGAGTSGRVAFWNGASSLSNDADLTFSTDTLTATKLVVSTSAGIGGAVGSDTLTVTGVGRYTSRVQVIGQATLPATRGGVEIGHDPGLWGFIESFETASTTYESFIFTAEDVRFHTGATPAERFRIGTAGQLGIGGATYGTSGQAFLSGGASAQPAWTSLDHGTHLTGLTDDDHTQYTLRSILTTRGDLYVRDASAVTRLAVGAAAGLFLRSDGTDPSWTTDAAARTDATNNRFRYLNIVALVMGSGNQTISDDTITVVNYGAEDHDTHAMHDNSTNNSRITVPIAGKYFFWAIDFWDNSTDVQTRGCRYRKNGSTYHTTTVRLHAASDGVTARSSCIFSCITANLAASDYIEHLVHQTSGGNLGLLSDGTLAGSSQFGCVYLGE